MKKTRVDRYRVIAILIIICGILYFDANLFAPRLIPRLFRIGVIRRPTNILILGTDITFDKNTGEPIPATDGRTDSILLLHIDPARYKVNILSIPRDSFVAVPGYGLQKINAANVLGGINLIKETVAGLTGIKIDYFIEINPYAIVKLVDLIGGLKLYVEKDMYYVDRAQNLNINLKQGWHRLSGKEAQGFIRFRHDFMGDLGRIERQQIFLETLFRALASPANIIKSPLAIGIASKNIKTDLPLPKMIRLANFVRMIALRDVRTFTATGEESESSYAGSILLPNKPALEKIIKDNF